MRCIAQRKVGGRSVRKYLEIFGDLIDGRRGEWQVIIAFTLGDESGQSPLDVVELRLKALLVPHRPVQLAFVVFDEGAECVVLAVERFDVTVEAPLLFGVEIGRDGGHALFQVLDEQQLTFYFFAEALDQQKFGFCRFRSESHRFLIAHLYTTSNIGFNMEFKL